MSEQSIVTQPVFLLFIAFSFTLTLGYYWGRRRNGKIFRAALNDLVEVIKPDDQTFTNIGGAIGYHANLFLKRKGPVSQVDATITLLPRHSWLYLPISKLIRKYDRLFITVYLKHQAPQEAHLIEVKHAGLGQRRIDRPQRFTREEIGWGEYKFYLYYQSLEMRERFMEFIQNHPDPGTLRHIALVPQQNKAFVFVIPRRGQVQKYFEPVYAWICSTSSMKSIKQ